ncbi:integrase protein [Calothrix sp. NIES-4101]|nr:integrase protein [Calothrix sp. NIES-4101]
MPKRLTVEGINLELKKVKIERRGNRGGLSLRATLPPRDGEGKPRQQYIALGLYDTPEHLEVARAKALELQIEMATWKLTGRFDWGRFAEAPKPESQNWELIKSKFEREYFRRRGDSPQSRLTWSSDYVPLMRSLQGEVSAESIIAAVEGTPNNTRTRRKAVEKLGKIAEFAGLEVDLSPYKGEYKLQTREIPSEELIQECRLRFENEAWQWVYTVMATYGLRNHEVFFCEISKKPPHTCRILEGKTEARIAYPLHPEWAINWEVWRKKKPVVSGQTYRDYGQRVNQYFYRHSIPFTPYDLRHAYAIRGSVQYKIPVVTMASWMGHKPSVHWDTYNRWIGESENERVFKEMVQRDVY